MTVSELIAELQKMHPDAEVVLNLCSTEVDASNDPVEQIITSDVGSIWGDEKGSEEKELCIYIEFKAYKYDELLKDLKEATNFYY